SFARALAKRAIASLLERIARDLGGPDAPPVKPYDIHTSRRACGEWACLTPYLGDSHLGVWGGDGHRDVRRRASGKRGAFLCRRLVEYGGRGVSVRQLGGNRAGEMRIARFLHNPKVTHRAMLKAALAGTCARVVGRHVLAIQDTSALRINEKGMGLSFHPVLAVDANDGTVLGLVDNF